MILKNLTLEMSAKPFRDTSSETMERVCKILFRQWERIIAQSEGISILLWLSDGSEILEYKGNLQESFEWCYWHGVAGRKIKRDKLVRNHIHHVPVKYVDAPPVLTYGWIKDLISTIKKIGGETTQKPIRVGAIFDPGPEFALSSFKYEKHREICGGNSMGNKTFVSCNTVLNADNQPYAGFPDGIKEGTSIGRFLGRQAKCFMEDLGYDYIWFSNGFGFGNEAWGYRGVLFDGKSFMPEIARKTSESILNFWHDFTTECSGIPVETRGSNMTAGLEIAKDACPLNDIYRKFKPSPPVNSPWAAINGDFGLSYAGWMSHIAQLPNNDFSFRFYIHDPWFLNSPWLDRYQQEPYDIYMPLSFSSIDCNGELHNPSGISFLTVDNSWGKMPDQVPDEVIPHILNAINHAPDTPGPLVYIYPFEQYHEMTFGEKPLINEIFANEWFIRGAINNGLPLNTVMSLDSFMENPNSVFGCCALIIPANALWGKSLNIINDFVNKGGNVILFGALNNADEAILDWLDIKLLDGIEGELDFKSYLKNDQVSAVSFPEKIIHYPIVSGGFLCETLKEGSSFELLAEAGKRALAVCGKIGKGKIAWVRSVNIVQDYSEKHIPAPLDANIFFPFESLMRMVLQKFGIDILFSKREPSTSTPVMTVSRSKNGFFFSGYAANINVKEKFCFPWGAPVFNRMDCITKNGFTEYTLPKSWHNECRIFVKQEATSELSCLEMMAGHPVYKRRMLIRGLKKAEVVFFPETGFENKTHIFPDTYFSLHLGNDNSQNDFKAYEIIKDSFGTYMKINNVSEPLLFSW